MSLRFPEWFGRIVFLPLLALVAAAPATRPAVLRVAADPNNLPFSNQQGEGFENKIAELVAREMGASLEYVWHAQRRGFFRETLKSGDADLVIGVPAALDMVLATRPYYRSSYVFVSRADRHLGITSFDDPVLKDVKIGVQLVGDYNTPPAQAFSRRHMSRNVVGYTVYGDYTEPNPPARIIDAVARGDVDVAVVWGPLAGYFAKKQTAVQLILTPTPPVDAPALPLAFDISMGVARANKPLRDRLNAIIQSRGTEIAKILDAYGVPRVASIADDEVKHAAHP
jgi:mxaJ protein